MKNRKKKYVGTRLKINILYTVLDREPILWIFFDSLIELPVLSVVSVFILFFKNPKTTNTLLNLHVNLYSIVCGLLSLFLPIAIIFLETSEICFLIREFNFHKIENIFPHYENISSLFKPNKCGRI